MTGTTIGQAASVGEGVPSEISQQDFTLHMTAMQQHYRLVDPAGAQPVVLYSLPAHINLMLPQLAVETTTRPPIRKC